MFIAAILLPILLGALLPLWRFKTDRSRGIYVMISVAITFVLSLYQILWGGDAQETLFHITETLPIAFKLDGVGRVFATIITGLWPLCSLYALEYMEEEESKDSFFSFYTMCFGVTLGIACSANLMTLYLFYELLTLATVPLVMHGGSQKSIRAGLQYLYYSIGGAALTFIGLMFVVYYGGTSDFRYGGLLAFTQIAESMDTHTINNLRIGYFICFVGMSVKAAVFPLHAWLPAASVAPTPVTALLHAVAVVKSGVFAILRATWFTFGPALLAGSWAQSIPLAMVVFTISFGCAMALKDQNIKRRLAYSTVSNLSYILLGVLLLTPEGLRAGMMHMVYHALMKITLFLCAGVYLLKKIIYVQDMRGIHTAMPLVTAVFTLGGLALTGIPPLLGFSSKWALGMFSVAKGGFLPLMGVVSLIISATLTAFYMLVPAVSAYSSKALRPYKPRELAPGWKAASVLVILSVVMLVISFYPTPLVDYLTAASSGRI